MRILPQPAEPHGATFDLVRMRSGEEVAREHVSGDEPVAVTIAVGPDGGRRPVVGLGTAVVAAVAVWNVRPSGAALRPATVAAGGDIPRALARAERLGPAKRVSGRGGRHDGSR